VAASASQIEVPGAAFVPMCVKAHGSTPRSASPIIQFAMAKTVPRNWAGRRAQKLSRITQLGQRGCAWRAGPPVLGAHLTGGALWTASTREVHFRSNHGGRQSARLGHMPGLSLAPLPVDTRRMAAPLASMIGDPDIPPSIFRFLMIKNLPPLWTRHGCHYLSSDRTHAAVPLVIPHS
jgi:hypothetical protein